MVPNWFWQHLSSSKTLTAWQTLDNLTIPLQRLSLSCKSKCSHLDLKVKCDGHGQLAPFDGGTGKSTFFFLSGDISVVYHVPHMKGIVVGERLARRLDGRCSQDSVGKSLSWFKLMFRHLSAFLIVMKFDGIFVPLVSKTQCTFDTADLNCLRLYSNFRLQNTGLCSETY